MARKVRALSDGAREALVAVKDAGEGVVFAELKEKGFDGLNSAHLTALVRRGFVTANKVKREFVQTVKREVNEYTVTDEGLKYLAELGDESE